MCYGANGSGLLYFSEYDVRFWGVRDSGSVPVYVCLLRRTSLDFRSNMG